MAVAPPDPLQPAGDRERKRIPWLALPGYPLFLELYTPLLQFALLDSTAKAAGQGPKQAPATVVSVRVLGAARSTAAAAASGQALPPAAPPEPGAPGEDNGSGGGSKARWVDKFAPQEQPRPSAYQVAQIMEMGFSRAQALVALTHTATVSSAYLEALAAERGGVGVAAQRAPGAVVAEVAGFGGDGRQVRSLCVPPSLPEPRLF